MGYSHFDEVVASGGFYLGKQGTETKLIDENGYILILGSGLAYNDFPPNAIQRSRQPSTNNPTLATFVGGIDQFTFAVNDYVSDNLECLHDWKEGTIIYPHIHWATNGTNVNDRAVKWELEYTLANGNGTEQFGTTVKVSAETVIPANTPDRTHFITELGEIDMSNRNIGTIITYNIKRITSTGTAPTSNPFGLQVSAHYQVDSLGSKLKFIK